MTHGSRHESITSYLLSSMLPLALFLPMCRPECLLGFVLGMTTAFGVVLPTLFDSIMARVFRQILSRPGGASPTSGFTLAVASALQACYLANRWL